jgi:glycerol uptake facilitator-like aquaporin
MNIFTSELLGTGILVAAVLLTGNPVLIALGFFIAILISNISGGHINPIVTMIKYIQGAISQQEAFNYLAGQILGGLIAYFLVKHFLG